MTDLANIYLIPTQLDEEGLDALPAYLLDAVKATDVFSSRTNEVPVDF